MLLKFQVEINFSKALVTQWNRQQWRLLNQTPIDQQEDRWDNGRASVYFYTK